MNVRIRWRDAAELASSLTQEERRALLLLSRLPLLWPEALWQIGGGGSERSTYTAVTRLRAVGVVASLAVPFRAGRSPGLLYLTDLGLAAASLVLNVDPRLLAQRNRLRGCDLLGALSGLPQLVACYKMLAALCTRRSDRPIAISWERAWRRRYLPPTAKTPLALSLPARTTIQWEDSFGDYLLLPDLGTFPLRAYRAVLGRLLALGSSPGGALPLLVIASDSPGRIAAWAWLLDDVSHSRRHQPLTACTATWGQLGQALSALAAEPASGPGRLDSFGSHGREQSPQFTPTSGFIPRQVSWPSERSRVGGYSSVSIGQSALTLSPVDRQLLDLVGRHPFLTVGGLAAVLGWTAEWALRRRNRLITLGLMRLLTPQEVNGATPSLELTELTVDGLAIVAAQQGLHLSIAVRYNGLAGGGPDHPIGARRSLLRNLSHTLGVDALFIGLYRTARLLVTAGSDDAVVEWQNAAACARHHVRPDGYGIYRHWGRLYGFLLEYDRGTMGDRDLLEKFAAYYDYLASGLHEADYVGFPTILVVARDSTVEKHIARVVSAAATGRAPLPVLHTTEWRIADPRNGHGLLGQIWREPGAATEERRYWAIGQAVTDESMHVPGYSVAGTRSWCTRAGHE